MKHVLITIICIAAMFCNSCSEDATVYRFVGDSNITRWDLQADFPVLVTQNSGESGSGLAYLRSFAGKCKAQIVVVMSGTNDSGSVTGENSCMEYSTAYVAALEAMKADQVYVFSILPRCFRSDETELNENIRQMNRCIASLIAERGSDDIIYLDVYSDFLDSDGKLNVNLTYDGLHLNPSGYEILADKLNPFLL